jgi:hypothetical protein
MCEFARSFPILTASFYPLLSFSFYFLLLLIYLDLRWAIFSAVCRHLCLLISPLLDSQLCFLMYIQIADYGCKIFAFAKGGEQDKAGEMSDREGGLATMLTCH